MFTQFFNIREKDGDIRCYQKKTLQSVIGAFYIVGCTHQVFIPPQTLITCPLT